LNAGQIAGLDVDARRLAIEIIAKLVNVKKTAAGLLLRPADLPEDLVRRFLSERDPTGEKRTKREAAPLLLEELAQRRMEHDVVRELIRVAATWEAFHLVSIAHEMKSLWGRCR